MVSAINAALSGLNAASKKLEVSANNIANVNTPGYTSQQVQDVSQANGGVNSVVKDPYDPANKGNDNKQGNGGNDITNDLVNTQIASYDFQANLKVIQASNEMLQSFLNIVT